MKRIIMVLTAVMVLSAALMARADGLSFWTEQQYSAVDNYAVREESGRILLTFLGDCTLGGVKSMENSRYGFNRLVAENGMAYPFAGLLSLTGADDLTIANLEGVLSDRSLKGRPKEYCFRGPAAFAEILKLGSVECVTLANNHSNDYGPEGLSDTKQALDQAGIGWFDMEQMAVYEKDGIRIGFVGVHYSASGDQGKRLQRQIRLLKENGCAAVITVMHAGEEHTGRISTRQRQIAQKAIEAGSCLVVGHHPHVVQGYEVMDGVPVVYSLGNCVFGGSMNPSDKDALILQAELSVEENELTGVCLRFYPVSVSGTDRINDYAPVLLQGERAEAVLQKMTRSTGMTLPAWNEHDDCVLRKFPK